MATEPSDPLNRMNLWQNDDLLLTEQARDRLEADFPGATRVFDWPELRALFATIDLPAGVDRRRRQRVAFVALAVAGAGAALAAALPVIELLGGDVANRAFGLSALLSLLGLSWTLWLALFDPHKQRWLEHRLQTERLRQFHFQFLISDPGLAARAFSDSAAFRNWSAARAKALAGFRAWLEGPVPPQLSVAIDDVNHEHMWQSAAWTKPPAVPARSDALDRYFDILLRQRIGVQMAYVREKMAPGWGSPQTRHQVIQTGSALCAVGAVALALAAAILLYFGETIDKMPFRILNSLTALAGVVAIFLRVVSDGLQLRQDILRYRNYQAIMAGLKARFSNPDPASRIDVLRRVEHASYQEMREFLGAHHASKFSLT